jgi:hypothetical protein
MTFATLPPAEVAAKVLLLEQGKPRSENFEGYLVVAEAKDEEPTPTEQLSRAQIPKNKDTLLSRNPAKMKGWFKVLSSGVSQEQWRKCHTKHYWSWYAPKPIEGEHESIPRR